MYIELKTVFDPDFKSYGSVGEGYQVKMLLERLNQTTPKPDNGTVYVPSDPKLEELSCFDELSNRFYGGMPIQIGYCNGTNTKLNCLEYHRDSEVDIPADDVILLLAHKDHITDGFLDTSKVRAFIAPAGTVVELYATTLHYAPCDAKRDRGYRVAIVLPRGTNTEKPVIETKCHEDNLLTARNKWLLAHKDSTEAKKGAVIGLKGDNIDIAQLI